MRPLYMTLAMISLTTMPLVTAQVAPEIKALNFAVDSTLADTVDGRSNAYIQEDWTYFAERLRNEFLALGEKKYRRREFQAAVLEYYNFLLHFPDDGLVPLVHYRMGRAYHRMGQLGLAREQYHASRSHPGADAKVRMVSIRQLARLDYDAGRRDQVLALTIDSDPYILVLKGFASLTVDDWPQAKDTFVAAKHYYPMRGQVILGRIISDLEQIGRIKPFSKWSGRMWNMVPGGGLARMGLMGEGMGFGVSVGTLALGTLLVDNWTRYVMAGGAAALYWASYGATSRQRERAFKAKVQEGLNGILKRTNIDTLWSFGHPAIY